MQSIPPLTVLLPAHNAEATIAPAIASTLNQTFSDFELWVLENGSNDRTAQIARSFADRRVKVFELGPVGFRGAIQYGLENASSEWLARMDADDLMFPHRLEVQMDVVKLRPDLMFVGAPYGLLTPFGHIFEHVFSFKSREINTLESFRLLADPSMLFNRRVALEVGIDPEFTVAVDLPLLFRMLSRGKGWQIAETVYLYRLKPNSMSKTTDFHQEGMRARAKYAPETIVHQVDPQEKPPNGWFRVAGLELLAGDGSAVRKAADFLKTEEPIAAQKLRWLSHVGHVGYPIYRWRYPSRYPIRHRPDWEKLFAPLLEMDGSK